MHRLYLCPYGTSEQPQVGDLVTASGDLHRKITRSNPSQASENPLLPSFFHKEYIIPFSLLSQNKMA